MVFLFADGFDSYANTAQLQYKLPGMNANNILSTSLGRFGGGCLQVYQSTVQSTSLFPLPPSWTVSSTNALGLGFWLKTVSPGLTDGTLPTFLYLNNNSTSAPIWNILKCQTGTSMKLAAITSGASPVTTNGNAVLSDGQWHWVEMAVLITTAGTGYIKVWVDGVLDINYSGATCGASTYLPTTITNISMTVGDCIPYPGSGLYGAYIDDIIVYDTSGSGAGSSAPIGVKRISQLNPAAAGDLTQFTPSTGANYACVNGGYASSSYVSDSGSGNVDLYRYGSLPYTPASVDAVIANYFAQNPGTGSANLTLKLKTGSTTISGTTTALSTAIYKLIQQIFNADASGSTWTPSSVNAMQVGMGD